MLLLMLSQILHFSLSHFYKLTLPLQSSILILPLTSQLFLSLSLIISLNFLHVPSAFLILNSHFEASLFIFLSQLSQFLLSLNSLSYHPLLSSIYAPFPISKPIPLTSIPISIDRSCSYLSYQVFLEAAILFLLITILIMGHSKRPQHQDKLIPLSI